MITKFQSIGFTIYDYCTTFKELDDIELMLHNKLTYLVEASDKRRVKADLKRLNRYRERLEERVPYMMEY